MTPGRSTCILGWPWHNFMHLLCTECIRPTNQLDKTPYAHTQGWLVLTCPCDTSICWGPSLARVGVAPNFPPRDDHCVPSWSIGDSFSQGGAQDSHLGLLTLTFWCHIHLSSISLWIYIQSWCHVLWGMTKQGPVDRLVWGEGQTKGMSASLPPSEWAHLEFRGNMHHDKWLLAGRVVAF